MYKIISTLPILLICLQTIAIAQIIELSGNYNDHHGIYTASHDVIITCTDERDTEFRGFVYFDSFSPDGTIRIVPSAQGTVKILPQSVHSHEDEGILTDHRRTGGIGGRPALARSLPLQLKMGSPNFFRRREVQLAPNPAHELLTVSAKQKITAYEVHDSNGQLLWYAQKLNYNSHDIAVSSVPTDTYYLTVHLEDGNKK